MLFIDTNANYEWSEQFANSAAFFKSYFMCFFFANEIFVKLVRAYYCYNSNAAALPSLNNAYIPCPFMLGSITYLIVSGAFNYNLYWSNF